MVLRHVLRHEAGAALPGIEFIERCLDDIDAVQIEVWKREVGMNAPIVITDTIVGSWLGLRPDLIEQLRVGA